jgi:hypothetical protein
MDDVNAELYKVIIKQKDDRIKQLEGLCDEKMAQIKELKSRLTRHF